MNRHVGQTMGVSMALVLILLGYEISTAHAQTWPNEPSGSGVLIDCSFNNATCDGSLFDVYKSGSTGNVSDAPLSPTSVLQMYLPGSSINGGAQVGMAFSSVKTELYWGTWFKLNSTYEGKLDNTNKTIFTNTPPVHNMFWGFYGPQNASSWVWAVNLQNSTGIDNTHLANSYGFWAFGNSCPIARNTWYRLEGYQKASTSSTSRDGILRWWVNGQLCGNYTNVNIPNGFAAFEYNQTWDGSAPNFGTKTKDWYMWFDHLHISDPKGSGGSTKSDTTPPSTPTGLRAQ